MNTYEPPKTLFGPGLCPHSRIGADDYMEKPFSLPELHARIKSHIRRYTSFSTPKEEIAIRQIGEITIDSNAYNVTVKGLPVELTTREFQLLDYLSRHPQRVFTKEQLLDAVWGCTDYIDDNTITVYIGRIREKMTKAGACYIKTVWGPDTNGKFSKKESGQI